MLRTVAYPARFLRTIRHKGITTVPCPWIGIAPTPVIHFVTVLLAFRIRFDPEIQARVRCGKREGRKISPPFMHHNQSPVVDEN